MLAKSALRQSAALDADAAQLLVVALNDPSVLPSEVVEWAAGWTSPHPVKPCVLVVLLQSAFEEPDSPMFDCSCLMDRAKRAGMQIILHHVTPDSVASLPAMDWLSPDECRWIPEVAESLASTCAADSGLPF